MPRYWRFLFGDPKKHGFPPQGGMYPVGKPWPGWPGNGRKQNLQMVQQGEMQEGDSALLYCTTSYPDHRKMVVGVGVITGVTHREVSHEDQWYISYEFRGFKCEVPWSRMLALSTALDGWNLRRLKYQWIAEVEPESFQAIVQAGQHQ